jgi:ribosomal protein S13
MFLGRKKVSLSQSIHPALCSVYGLGDSRMRIILCKLGCVRKTKIANIQQSKRNGLSRFIDRRYSTEKFLRKPTTLILRNLVQFVLIKEFVCLRVYLLMVNVLIVMLLQLVDYDEPNKIAILF